MSQFITISNPKRHSFPNKHCGLEYLGTSGNGDRDENANSRSHKRRSDEIDELKLEKRITLIEWRESIGTSVYIMTEDRHLGRQILWIRKHESTKLGLLDAVKLGLQKPIAKYKWG